MNLKLASTYYINQSDLIDNVTYEGKGDRQGNDARDNFLYSSFSLHYDFFSSKEEVKSRYDDIDFSDLVSDDDDKDGVKNSNDNCPNNPENVEVDKQGCPLDGDNDGVPDYADLQPNSVEGKPVDHEGYTLTDEAIANMQDTLGTERARMFDIYPSMKDIYQTSSSSDNKGMDESTTLTEYKIKLVDFNGDGMLTPDEVERIIDNFFEGSEEFTIGEIYEIIDYLFDQ
jgi:hypothetical protein